MPQPGDAVGIALIERGHPTYPEALLDLQAPPERVYSLGDATALGLAPAGLVAIVGTRGASPYGLRVAHGLARALAAAGIGVVSGLARGIDTAAHRGALEAGGKTVAVLGTGVDVPYPVGNRGLHAELVAKGLVLSESRPGMGAGKGAFPRRNRLIAALAKVTIVVEAPQKSGAINTANQALEIGRTVAAVPGPIDSGRSAGSNQLLRDGAQVIGSYEDALSLFGKTAAKSVDISTLTGAELAIWGALKASPREIDALVDLTGLPARRVLESIARLDLLGLIKQSANGEIDRFVLN